MPEESCPRQREGEQRGDAEEGQHGDRHRETDGGLQLAPSARQQAQPGGHAEHVERDEQARRPCQEPFKRQVREPVRYEDGDVDQQKPGKGSRGVPVFAFTWPK